MILQGYKLFSFHTGTKTKPLLSLRIRSGKRKKRKIGYGEITAGDISKYLLILIHSKTSSAKDYSSEALNKIRSGISFFFAFDFPKLGFELSISRLFT